MAIIGSLMTPGGGRGRESYGLEMSPDNSLLVACGDVVVVVAMRNAATVGDVVATVGGVAADDVVVVVGVAVAVVVWVQWC